MEAHRQWSRLIVPCNATGRRFILLALVTVMGGGLTLGCGTTCEEIRASHDRFRTQRHQTADAHAILSIPLGLANQLASDRLAERPSAEVEIAVLRRFGLKPPIHFDLLGARLAPAEPGFAGVIAEIGVRHAQTELFTLELEVAVAPRVDLSRRQIAIAVDAETFRRVTPRLGPGGKAGIVRWLADMLPPAVALMVPEAALGELADAVVGWGIESGFPIVRDHILAPLDVGTEVTMSLPDLPITAVTLASTEGAVPALHLRLWTSLPVQTGLEPILPQPPAHRVVLHIAGDTVAAAANRAISDGLLPQRFTRQGKPDPQGELEAGLSWGPSPRPLKIHLWQTRGECLYTRIGGSVAASLVADTVQVDVQDGVYESVRGSASLEATSWLAPLFADAVETSLAVGRTATFALAGRSTQVAVEAISVGANALRFDLTVETLPAKP